MQLVILSIFFVLTNSKVYFKDNADVGSVDLWVKTDDASVTLGTLSRELKEKGSEGDYCLKMMNDSSYYRFSSPFSEPLDMSTKSLFFQYTAAYVQNIDCGGAYFKLYSSLDPHSLNGDSEYSIMFGADVCGYGTRKVHVIFHHKGVNYELKDSIPFEVDSHPHFFELYVSTDKKLRVTVDKEVKVEGTLEELFVYLPPKVIDDPNDIKPADWVEEELIDDPNDKKPDDWDDRPNIPDESAVKPSDWDDATDGEWEPDSKTNPNYKGEWAPKKLPNPEYKGVWKAKQIPNPDYKPDNTFANYKLTHIAFECWTVKSKTEFDNIFVTDDEKEASLHAETARAEVLAQSELMKVVEKPAETPPSAEDGESKDVPVEDQAHSEL